MKRFLEKFARRPMVLYGSGMVVAGAVLGGGFSWWFSAPSAVSLSDASQMVSRLTDHRAKVSKVFPGPAGLTGIVIQGSRGPMLAWMTDSGSAIIIGDVINRKNENLSRIEASRVLRNTAMDQVVGGDGKGSVAPTVAPAQAAPVAQVTPVADTTSASDGEAVLRQFVENPPASTIADPDTASGTHVLYAFVDPNCIFCHRLYQEVRENLGALRKAGVRVEYVPVAILKQSSIQKAALEIAGGWQALRKDEDHFNVDTEEGGLPDQGASHLNISLANANTQWMQKISLANDIAVATPLLVWKAGDGHVYYLSGYPNADGFNRILESFQSGWKPHKEAK